MNEDSKNQSEFKRIRKKCGSGWTLDIIENWLFYTQPVEVATSMLEYIKKNYKI